MASSTKVKSNRYVGVYYYPLEDKDKTYLITYKDERGKKVWLTMGKHSAGVRENTCSITRTEIVHKIKHGEVPNIIRNKRIKKECITFDMIAQNYLSYKEKKITKGSYKDTKSKYNNHIKPYLGDKLAEEITVEDIDQITEDKEDILAPKTINMLVELIGTIYNFAIEQKKFKGDNPVKKAHKLAIDNNRERFLSKSEIKILLDKVKDNHQAYLFTILSLSTGARIQTTCAIQQKHIKLESNSILLKDIKNKKTYTGFIKQEFIPYIEQSIQNLDPNDFVLGNGDIVKQVQRKMRPILNNLFNNKLEKDDRKNRVVIHTLRHTFASQLISNNAPIFTVKKLMHHADIKTTMRYVSVDNNFGQNFVDNIF